MKKNIKNFMALFEKKVNFKSPPELKNGKNSGDIEIQGKTFGVVASTGSAILTNFGELSAEIEKRQKTFLDPIIDEIKNDQSAAIDRSSFSESEKKALHLELENTKTLSPTYIEKQKNDVREAAKKLNENDPVHALLYTKEYQDFFDKTDFDMECLRYALLAYQLAGGARTFSETSTSSDITTGTDVDDPLAGLSPAQRNAALEMHRKIELFRDRHHDNKMFFLLGEDPPKLGKKQSQKSLDAKNAVSRELNEKNLSDYLIYAAPEYVRVLFVHLQEYEKFKEVFDHEESDAFKKRHLIDAFLNTLDDPDVPQSIKDYLKDAPLPPELERVRLELFSDFHSMGVSLDDLLNKKYKKLLPHEACEKYFTKYGSLSPYAIDQIHTMNKISALETKIDLKSESGKIYQQFKDVKQMQATYISACGEDGMKIDAHYLKLESGKTLIVVCPGLLIGSGNDAKSMKNYLEITVGHEFGHGHGYHLEGDPDYTSFNSCMIKYARELEHPERFERYLAEMQPDEWGVETFMVGIGDLIQKQTMNQINGVSGTETQEEILKSVQNAASPYCHDLNADFEKHEGYHPNHPFRIKHFILENPTLRKALGCPALDEGTACGWAKPTH